MVEVLLDLTDDAVLDMHYLVRLIGHTALMSHHNDRHALILVQLLEQLHHLHRSI